MKTISSRARALRGSRIVEVARTAARYGAIDLAFGVPDSPAPELLKLAASEAIRLDEDQYGASEGLRALRDAVGASIHRSAGVEVDAETECTITCGASEGIFVSLLTVVDPGDEILVFDPCYENHLSLAALLGARIRAVELRPPDFALDTDQLAAAFGNRTKAVLLNTPHNPTGKVFTESELRAVAEGCQKWGAYCITDEIYERFVYDGRAHVSMLRIPGMRERTIAVSSLSKTYAVTGWRVGWAVAPPGLTENLRKVHESLTVSAPAPLQRAAVAALRAPGSFHETLAATYQARRDRLVGALESAGFACHPPEGALYVLADIRGLTSSNAAVLADRLIRSIGVAAAPGTAFSVRGDGWGDLLRFCFGKSQETLDIAADRLRSLPVELGRDHAKEPPRRR